MADKVLADATTWTRAVQRVAELVEEAHHAYPEHAGLALTDLRNTLKREFPFEGLFDALIASACEQGYYRAPARSSSVSGTERSFPNRFAPRAMRCGKCSPPNQWTRPRGSSWPPIRSRNGR